jgi:hypothetical protein
MMQHFDVEAELSDEEFYAKTALTIREILSFPCSPDAETVLMERNMYWTIFDGAVSYLENKKTKEELRYNSEKLKGSLDDLGSSFEGMSKERGNVFTGITGLAETSRELSATINETMGLTKKALILAYECQDNSVQALREMGNAQDNMNHIKKGIRKVEKEIVKIGEEAEATKKGYEAQIAAKDAVIEIGRGMGRQGKNSGEGDYVPKE